ncbi:AAA family ATPase [Nocardiopsis oceani]
MADTSPGNGSAPSSGSESSPGEPTRLLRAALHEVSTVIVGQERMVERSLIALVAQGHCLIEGVPGIAKTLAVSTMAKVTGGSFSRVQFTPDLVPSDIVGTRIYHPSTERFDVELGPVFANFVLADEINRAPAKVQSALLEVMAERQVSIGGTTYPLPSPFIVIATQNPVESEGVYPLPEAQRDRFLMKVNVGHPQAHEEMEILRRMSSTPPTAHQILDPVTVSELQADAERVHVHQLIADYIVRLVMATREPQEYQMPDLREALEVGASPRATLGLVASARALALLRGRDYVLPDDVRVLAHDVIAHRLVLTFDALADGITPDQVVDRILSTVPAPRVIWDEPPSGETASFAAQS